MIFSDIGDLDDWLLEKVKSNEAREIMEVIEARDRTGSLILCSQFAPSAWHAKLGNGAIADAVPSFLQQAVAERLKWVGYPLSPPISMQN